MTAEAPRQIGPYEVLGMLGEGAGGQVYKAVEPERNRLVAIKVLPAKFAADEERVERFEREAQAVSLLNHPNVVRILDKGRAEELLYFVMEYVPGTSLAAVMGQRRLSLPEVFRVAKGICQGLEAAHRQSIVHRDVNPRNVLVSEDLSVVKLVDFGISRVEDISRQQGTLSTSEFSLGSLHYMSPEQATNMVTADYRTDIYSLGVTLYEMLTGRVPVGRFSLPSQINNEVPSDIDPLVLKCLEIDPANRYQAVSRVRDDLNRLEDRLKLGLVNELRGISRQTSKIFLKSTGTFRKRKRPLLVVAVILALAAAGVAAYLLTRRPPPLPAARSEATGETAGESPDPEPFAPEPSAPEPSATALEEDVAAVEPEPPVAKPQPQPQNASPAAAKPATDQARKDLEVARDKLAAGLTGPALEDLESFVKRHAATPLLPEAYLLIAQAHLAEGRTKQALATYIEIGSRFGDSPEAAAAAFERARLIAGRSGREAAVEARQLYAAVAADHPGSRWAAAALAAQAQIEMTLKLTVTDPLLGGQGPAALLPWRALAEGYPKTPEAEWALWQLGETYADSKQYELAAQSFAEMGRRFPQTEYEAWWRAGQIYERRLDDNPKALDAYRRVPSSSSHHGDAQKRIGRLSP